MEGTRIQEQLIHEHRISVFPDVYVMRGTIFVNEDTHLAVPVAVRFEQVLVVLRPHIQVHPEPCVNNIKLWTKFRKYNNVSL